jgi:hypothetical protein
MVYMEMLDGPDTFETRFATYANLPSGSATICSELSFCGYEYPVPTEAGVVAVNCPVQESTVYILTE